MPSRLRPRGRTLRLAILALGALLTCGGAVWAQTPPLDVVPTPADVAPAASDRPVTITGGAPIFTAAGDLEAQETARYLSQLAAKTRGLRLVPRVGAAGSRSPSIALVRQPNPALGSEGYTLQIGDGRATVTAATGAGLFYGAATLWQLLTPGDGRGAVTLQPVTINDQPRFAWRGLLLDSARHFQSPAFVEQLIDWMALHKLNVLQWHLTDDQGWRLQIRKYPRLTEVGAWRTTLGGERYGGFYTQAEVRRIVAHAKARHVTIVPEIEMPGHALAAILAYPELASTPGAGGALQHDWGIFPYLYAPSDRTFGFLEDVLSEVMDLFPGPFINVGGDEAVKDQWRGSPQIQAQIKALGLANEDALQGWFTARIGAFLSAHGRRLIGWDDILAGGLPPDAAVVSWHLDGAITAARLGHDAVIATDPILYFDHRQSDLPDEPPGRGVVVSLRDVYQYEPAPPTLTAQDRAHFIGVQANLWTEHISTDARLEQMAFPRAAAVAELGWSQPQRKDWASFVERLPDELARYQALGLHPDDSALEVKLDQQIDPATGAVKIALSNQAGFGQIRFTTDGSPPSAASPLYQVAFAPPERVRAATFDGARLVSPLLDSRIDPAQSERLSSQQLTLCTSKLALNLEAPAAVDAARGIYLIDIMNPCWIFPRADLIGVTALTVGVTPLPFNFQIGLDTAKIAQRSPTTDNGELEVRLDTCAGDLLVSAPLSRVRADGSLTPLTVAIPPRSGRHDLCLSFTGRRLDPLWAVGWVQLSPQAVAMVPGEPDTP